MTRAMTPGNYDPALLRAAAADPQRPRVHFVPPAGWLNDPNGLGQWEGRFHMFYQHNPSGAVHAQIHWGHAVSADLVHWEHLPIALAPTPGGPDADGCWSGCLVDDGGVPTLIYSSNLREEQRACVAISGDGLLTWEKDPGNPVIPAPPPGLELVAYRDHCVWREGEEWLMLMGAGIAGRGGAVLLYRSSDLRHWEYLHPLALRDAALTSPLPTGPMWECPDFFALGDRHALMVAVWANRTPTYTALMLGTYADRRFVPEQIAKADYGDHYFYAPQSFRDDQGRRIIFGWLSEGRSERSRRAHGWAGAMSLPRELTLGSDGQARWRPAAEVAQLRGAHVAQGGIVGSAGAVVELPTLRGEVLELNATLTVEPGSIGGLLLRRSPDGAEQTAIFYDQPNQTLFIDRSRASHDQEVDQFTQRAPLRLAPDEPLHLHIFLDRSVIEVFANERIMISSRIYPTLLASDGVAVTALEGVVQLERLDAWQLSL